MASIDSETAAPHDFSAISPSAYALLVMKGDTTIPYAREAAALLKQAGGGNFGATPNSAEATPNAWAAPKVDGNPVDYWTRVMHFESRYWSIDQLLDDQPYTNILELSSGFSFRGLALSRRQPVFYIDTDLEAVIAGKQRFVDALTGGSVTQGVTPGVAPGHYEIQPLNVLDPAAFKKIVARFPPGPIAIVNEGLLVYLDSAEKERLCQNIHECLTARGGCWITADIYLQRRDTDPLIVQNEAYKQWQEQHKIEEKKFSNIQDAEAFFHRMGFAVDKQARPNYDRLYSLARLREAGGTSAIEYLRQPSRTRLHATWRLVAQKNAAAK
jgi:hypothetical protein